MNRALLYRYLETRFSEAGLSPEQIQLHTQYYREKFDAMTDRELSAEVQACGGPQALAESAVKAAFNAPQHTPPLDAMQTRQDLDLSGVEKEEAVAMQPDASKSQNPLAAEAQTITVDRQQLFQHSSFSAEQYVSAVTEEEAAEIERGVQERTASMPQFPTAEEAPPKKKRVHSPFYYKTWRGTPTAEQQKRFKNLFWATSPLWGLALLLCAVGLLVVLGGIAFLIPALFVAMLVWIGGGCAISLVGLIYGLLQLFLIVPKGLDEIGLGIMVAGFTMIGGILLYNASLRLMPYLLHKWMAFIRCFCRTVPEFYGYVRGEVYRK